MVNNRDTRHFAHEASYCNNGPHRHQITWARHRRHSPGFEGDQRCGVEKTARRCAQNTSNLSHDWRQIGRLVTKSFSLELRASWRFSSKISTTLIASLGLEPDRRKRLVLAHGRMQVPLSLPLVSKSGLLRHNRVAQKETLDQCPPLRVYPAEAAR